MKSGSLVASFCVIFCLLSTGSAAVLRRTDSRSLLVARESKVLCTGPECPEGCLPEGVCDINKVVKEIKVDCEDVKKELSDDDDENPCAAVLDPFGECKTTLDETLKDDLPPQEKDYCECKQEEEKCKNKKKACCDAMDDCGPWSVDDVIQDIVKCDFGAFDQVTTGTYYEQCLTEAKNELANLANRLQKAQAAINLKKKACQENDKCCKAECQDCEPKCQVVQNTKKLSCQAYDKCMTEAKKELKKAMKTAREAAEKLKQRFTAIAELRCEAQGQMKGAAADSVEKCKAAIDSDICPIPDCKPPKPEECDKGNPQECVKDKEEYPTDQCGPAPTPPPTKPPTKAPPTTPKPTVRPTCPDGVTPLPWENCGPACTEGKCPDGITCKDDGCGEEPCKPKPGFGVCPDQKQCKVDADGTNCGPDPCNPKPGHGVCPDGLTCKIDNDGSNCGPQPPKCEEPAPCKKVPADQAAIKCETSEDFAKTCKCTCKEPPPVPPPTEKPPVPPTPPTKAPTEKPPVPPTKEPTKEPPVPPTKAPPAPPCDCTCDGGAELVCMAEPPPDSKEPVCKDDATTTPEPEYTTTMGFGPR